MDAPTPPPPPLAPRRVLIVEDDESTQARLLGVLRQAMPQACGRSVSTLASARAELTAAPADLVLLDVNLPDGNGLTLLPWLQAHAPATEAVVVSSLGDDATILQALRSGATGYLLKNGSDAELVLSLASIDRGGAPIDPVIARRILALLTAPAPVATIRPASLPASQLSDRETQVLQLVAQGSSNREIAEQLHLSLNTVECHAKSIYRKRAVHSRSAAVHSARQQGWID